MTTHDRFAAHEFIHHWWFNYDEGNFDILFPLLTDDCHIKSRTERGDHPHEQFIAADTQGREASMAWTSEHRRHSPYPLRHNATNIFVFYNLLRASFHENLPLSNNIRSIDNFKSLSDVMIGN